MTVLMMQKTKKGLLKMDSIKSIAVIGLPEIDSTGKNGKNHFWIFTKLQIFLYLIA
jgi:hypothetical protein